MQPKTDLKFDPRTFGWMKDRIKDLDRSRRALRVNPRYATPVPENLGLQLTHRCNLGRCRHCFQWGEQGFFHGFDKEKQSMDLDIFIVEKLIRETQEAKSRLYLWGGEPLVHREWESIAKLLEENPRWTLLCTNGLLLEEKLESVLRLSPHLFISLDGFREEHDAMRGQGTYDRLMKNLNLLLDLKRKGHFTGLISLNCVLSEPVVPRLFDLVEYCEGLGVDAIYIGFPWYISEETAQRMDEYFKVNFDWLRPLPPGPEPTWHFYQYNLNLSVLTILQEQLRKLNSRVWRMRINLWPALESEEIEDFLLGKEVTALQRTCCLAITNRMDVLADGSLSACKNFPEFTVGNLYTMGVIEVWHSAAFSRLREIINAGLMPVCSKCVLLYLNGI